MKKNELKPFDKVLVRDEDNGLWQCEIFSQYIDYRDRFLCVGSSWRYCIPYEGNENLLGKTDDYVEPYKPKDGDFVTYVYKDGDTFVMIYDWDDWYHASLKIKGCCQGEKPHYHLQFSKKYIWRKPSTMAEKQQLLDALHKEDKDWDVEKKKIVEYKWKPKQNEDYWYVCHLLTPRDTNWCNDETDKKRHEAGNCFRTEAEAQAMADKFKKLLKGE